MINILFIENTFNFVAPIGVMHNNAHTLQYYPFYYQFTL